VPGGSGFESSDSAFRRAGRESEKNRGVFAHRPASKRECGLQILRFGVKSHLGDADTPIPDTLSFAEAIVITLYAADRRLALAGMLTKMSFPIIAVPPESVVGDEQLGSKTKFWFDHSGGRWLFKEAREKTGEDWAEKIASAIATLVKISTAHVELSEFKGRRGCASQSFVTVENESLVHGNEILAVQIHGYDRSKKLGQADHTIRNIFIAITKLFADAEETRDKVLFQLAEYLVLDALIGNTDRHHENWGLLVRDVTRGIDDSAETRIRVAPSFDHASSLGRELRDEKREEIVQREAIASYVHRARGGVYLKDTDPHGANPLERSPLRESLLDIYPLCP
jgi:hypothetical protein